MDHLLDRQICLIDEQPQSENEPDGESSEQIESHNELNVNDIRLDVLTQASEINLNSS